MLIYNMKILNFFNYKMDTLSIRYDGTIENLKEEVGKVEAMFRSFNNYRQSLNKIKTDIYNNFDKYKDYGLIMIGNINIINVKVPQTNFYFYSLREHSNGNETLYTWEYSLILLWLAMILFIFLIFILIYCYIYDMDVTLRIFNIFNIFNI